MSWLTAEQALALLGTKPQTLYANVSRGRIRARPDPRDARKSLYSRQDVERLAERHSGRRKAEAVAADTMRFGDPILPSSVSTISGGQLFYRGQRAARLAESQTLEQIAGLLWQSGPVTIAPTTETPVQPFGTAFALLGRMAAGGMPSCGRSRSVLCRDGRAVVGVLVDTVAGGSADAAMPVHERIARAWARPDAADLIRRTLVLLADHELNASTFATRVAMSTGAPLAAAILSGLCALTGPRHGTAAAAVLALAEEARSGGVRQTIVDALSHGRALPAFGHPLYADGDCRAAALIGLFELPRPFGEIRSVGEELIGEKVNIDFVLAALTQAYALPTDAPLMLFAIARSVGWIAHALEQHEADRLIRPRARYTGPALERF